MTYSIDLASIAKNFGTEGNIIGYANKFYTLWSYKITENVETHEPLIITPNTNISVDGWLWIHKNKFYFEHKYYSWTYYGPEHSFPIDSNGKAKQIKNHKIEITNYEKTGDNEYKVISWEFVK